MLKIKDVYAVPATVVDIADWTLRGNWFPEVGIVDMLGEDGFKTLQAEGRLQIRKLVDEYVDGYRICMMHTIWFDGEPVLIVQDAGRSGQDHRQRWVTDAARYWALLTYMLSKVRLEADNSFDVVDPEKLVYEEDVFFFYGTDFSKKLGHPAEARTEGYLLMHPGDHGIPVAEPQLYMAILQARVTTPAPYIRRGTFVLKLRREVTSTELASNPRIALCRADTDERYFWYEPVERPQDAPVLSI